MNTVDVIYCDTADMEIVAEGGTRKDWLLVELK